MASGAAIGLALTLGACVSASEPAVEPTIVSGADILEQRLGSLAQFAGPLALQWESCPDGGTPLGPLDRVNAPLWGSDDGGPEQPGRVPHGYVEIGRASAYTDDSGVVRAWCGESAGHEEPGIIGPDLGTIMIIPNPAGCEVMPRSGEQLSCPGQPLVYEGQEPLPESRTRTSV